MLYCGGFSGSLIFSCVYDRIGDIYLVYICYVCFIFFLYSCFFIHLKFEFGWFQSHIGRGLYLGFIVVDLRMDKFIRVLQERKDNVQFTLRWVL